MKRIPPHSLILMIGPSGAGKTTFCQKWFLPYIRGRVKESADCTYLTSAQCRRELLNVSESEKSNIAQYSHSITGSREQAVEFLMYKLEAHMKFPIASKYIVVDEYECIQKEYRDKFISLANKYHYNVFCIILDYDQLTDFTVSGHGVVSENTLKDINIIKSEIYKDLRNQAIDYFVFKKKVSVFPISSIRLKIDDYEEDHTIPCHIPALIISDIEGCYDDIMYILDGAEIEIDHSTKKLDLSQDNHLVILNGNLTGPGPKNEEVLDLVEANIDNPNFYVIRGNNEDENDSRFHPFLYNQFFIITHSPCLSKYLRKTDVLSLGKQIHWYSTAWSELLIDMEERKFSFPKEDKMYLRHYFGAIPVSNPGQVINNRVATNGGASQRGRLQGINAYLDRHTMIDNGKEIDNKFWKFVR